MMRSARVLVQLGLLGLLGREVLGGPALARASGEPALRIAEFTVDATPPIGGVVAYARVQSVADPLYAKGIVLLPAAQQPIVICVVDWIGIGNESHDGWRTDLASAADTVSERVAVHTVHQHDGPRCDGSAVRLFPQPEHAARHFDRLQNERVKTAVAEAVRASMQQLQPVTHVGVGKARVEQVASNRRILGPDGTVAKMRFSSCVDPEVIAAPEGVIDPDVKLVSFWQDDQPLACLAYYATHPMSHYGQGDVSADFVGLARAAREAATRVPHLYFTGAGGNIAAGKYNDGSPQRRPELAERLAAGMRRAWEGTVKTPLAAAEIHWRTEPVALPPAPHLDAARLEAALQNPQATDVERLSAASDLAWLRQCQNGAQIELTCLQLGPVALLHLPGELFVEYQLAAQAMRPDLEICLAAYGDYGPGYIGTTVAYTQGGYETSQRASRVAPEVEPVLLAAMRRVVLAADR